MDKESVWESSCKSLFGIPQVMFACHLELRYWNHFLTRRFGRCIMIFNAVPYFLFPFRLREGWTVQNVLYKIGDGWIRTRSSGVGSSWCATTNHRWLSSLSIGLLFCYLPFSFFPYFFHRFCWKKVKTKPSKKPFFLSFFLFPLFLVDMIGQKRDKKNRQNRAKRTAVVAQLVEQSLTTPENCSLNAAGGN